MLVKVSNAYDIFSNDTFGVAAKIQETMLSLGMDNFYIAGGYFRDIENGKDFKDIDVFVMGSETPDPNLPAIRYDVTDSQEWTSPEGHKINLVKLSEKRDLAQLLDRFDIALCQIGMLHNGSVWATQAYLEDVKNKTITVLRKPTTDGDRDHIQRVQAKYLDHKVLYPNIPEIEELDDFI